MTIMVEKIGGVRVVPDAVSGTRPATLAGKTHGEAPMSANCIRPSKACQESLQACTAESGCISARRHLVSG